MPNFRRDHWASALDERDWWEIYQKTRRMKTWVDAVNWIEDTYSIQVGKTSYYDFMKEMGRTAALERVMKLRAKRDEAASLAGEARLDDATARDTLLILANDAALEGDAAQTVQYANSAAALWGKMLEEKGLALKEKAQATKDSALALAREKFEAAERRLERVAEIADAARGGKVDPAKVADEIDRILGRKK